MLLAESKSSFECNFVVNSTADVGGDFNIGDYDKIIVFFSGGKDSVACALHLLDLGVPASKIELHHHLIDGKEGSDLMDWPITDAYCQAFADAFGFRLQFSWKQGGFEREMLRQGHATAPTMIPTDEGIKAIGGKRGEGTRLKFPQVSSDLSVRWCSSYLKIMVGQAYINNNARFLEGKTLVLTGERAQESASRAKYKVFEPHRTDNRNGARVKRWVDHWRPIHKWTEEQVWEIIERYRVAPHPAYELGWGRTSCLTCIFGSDQQWASAYAVAPRKVIRIAQYEERFGYTIDRNLSVMDRIAKGKPYQMDQATIELSMSRVYDRPIIVQEWKLPAGAFGEGCGPT